MEQNESTISLTAPDDSNWGVVEQFVIDNGYKPTHTPWNTYIERMISCYYDDLNYYDMTDGEFPIHLWVRTFGDLLNANTSMEAFDYE